MTRSVDAFIAPIALIALIASANAVSAQTKASVDLESIAGSIKPWPVASESWGYNAAAGVTAAQKAAVKANVVAVYNVFAQTPVMAKPMGFTVWPFRGMDYADAVMYKREPWAIAAHFKFNFIWHWFSQNDETVHANGDGEGIGFEVGLNQLRCIFDDNGKPFMEDELGGMYFEPVKVGEVHGFAEYAAGCIVLTKRPQPLYLPVSRERVLNNLIAGQRDSGKEITNMIAALKQMGRAADAREIENNDAPRRNRVRYLEQMLATMTPAERAQPAYLNLRYPGTDSINVFGQPDPSDYFVKGLVMANPNFFDRTLPRTAIQVITSTFGCWRQKSYTDANALQATCDVETEPFFRSYGQLFKTIREQLDWTALVALLQKR